MLTSTFHTLAITGAALLGLLLVGLLTYEPEPSYSAQDRADLTAIIQFVEK